MPVSVTMDADLADLNDISDFDGEKKLATPAAPAVEPTYTFTVRDKLTGKVGSFTSTVPDVRQRVQLARRRAQLTGGVPWTSLAPYDALLIDALAITGVCLIGKPDWFTDQFNARTTHVLLTVAEEVNAHHERWFRGLANLGPGATYRSLVDVAAGVGADVQATEPR